MPVQKLCEKRGISYFDVYHHDEITEKLDFTTTKNTGDYIHPNDAGCEIPTPYIIQYMRFMPPCERDVLQKI